jgi:hypothetical protein
MDANEKLVRNKSGLFWVILEPIQLLGFLDNKLYPIFQVKNKIDKLKR